jgi:hypothetical protein
MKEEVFFNLPAAGRSRWDQGLTAAEMKRCHWVKPTMVCQIRFNEWTRDDRLRQPAFLGIRVHCSFLWADMSNLLRNVAIPSHRLFTSLRIRRIPPRLSRWILKISRDFVSLLATWKDARRFALFSRARLGLIAHLWNKGRDS